MEKLIGILQTKKNGSKVLLISNLSSRYLFGSGGWLPTLSKLLVNALDIASKPPHISALLSSLEGAHASQGAEYNGESPILTSGGA